MANVYVWAGESCIQQFSTTVLEFDDHPLSEDFERLSIVCGPEDAPEAFKERLMLRFGGGRIEEESSIVRFFPPDATPTKKGKKK